MRSYEQIEAQYEALIAQKNEIDTRYENGIYDRWVNPVLTRAHVPPFWCYDPNPETNPFMMQRLGINAAFNSGALLVDGKFTLVARMEGADRKSFFAVAQSDSGVEGFRFWDKPILLPDTCPEETNVYDMRLTQHEDGWIYGVFCSESKDKSVNDLSAAVAAAGIVRTKDLKTWERRPNLRCCTPRSSATSCCIRSLWTASTPSTPARWTTSSRRAAAAASASACARTSRTPSSTRSA